MGKPVALVYDINVPDATLIADLTAQFVLNADGYLLEAPSVVAVTFYNLLVQRGSYPAQPPPVNALPVLVDPTDPFKNPSVRSELFTQHPANGEDPYPLDKKQFSRRSGGWLGIGWLFGEKTNYSWWGHVVYTPPLDVQTPAPVTKVPMPLRRWIDGAETPLGGEGQSGGNAAPARRASRHPQGFGFFFDNTVDTRTHNHNENGAAAAPGAWERLYIRIMRFPDTPTRIWRSNNSITGGGPLLTLTAGGALGLTDFDGISTATPLATLGTLKVNTWYKLDLVYSYGAVGAGMPFFKGYLNGTKVADMSGTALTNMVGGPKNCSQSVIGGGSVAGAANNAIWHCDDWVGANVPAATYEIGGTNDFIKGSRVALIGATGFATNHGAWVGDWRLTRQRPVTTGVAQQLTSSTSTALLSVTTDAAVEIDGQPNQMGIAALNIALFSDKGGAGANGQLGYGFNGGGGLSLGPIVQAGGTFAWANKFWSGPAAILPLTPMAGLELTHQHGASTDPAKVQALQATAEIIGVFGDEDIYPQGAIGNPIAEAPAGTVNAHIGIHNAPYPHTPQATQRLAPESGVVIKAGQYTGNGTGQDLKFRAPVHFLWIRPMTGGTGGTQWWSSLNAAHVHGMKAYAPDTLLELLMDPAWVAGGGTNGETNMDLPPAPDNLEQAVHDANQLAYGFHKHDEADAVWQAYLDDPTYYFGRMLGDQAQGGPDQAVAGLYAVPPSPWLSTQQQQALVRVAGSHADSNAPGVVYNYLAWSDAGMRFSNAGALAANNFGNDFVSPLDVEQFTPETAFVQTEEDVSSTTQTLMFKGLGSAAAAISVLTLAEIASGLQFATGTLTYKAGLAVPVPSPNQHAYLVFRRNDKSGDPGIPSVLWLGTYVGDGGGVRTINFAPSGKRPLWAIVVGHNGTAFTRDPYHTGTTSTGFPNTSNPATGIIAGGIDAIQLGSALNQNGIVYDILVFPGSATAGNGGWSVPGEFIPVEPTTPADGPWDDPPEAPEPPDGGDDLPPFTPGPPPDDFGTQCVGASTRIINQALSRIGVSKQVGDIVTENTMEAVVARLHYSDDVDATLRDFAWPFATHYATLAVVAGPTPVAAPDWLYAYRRPSDCVFERRLCVSRGGGVDPTPPPFQLGSDATGGLIYTNEPDAVLEYTARPSCAAGLGDPLFRDALTWRHAGSLAPALSRMTDVANLCLTKYQTALALAFAVLRPGNPGRPATVAPTIDAAPAAEAANVEVVNRGLLRIGAQTITNLTTDQSRGAVAVRAIFEAELQTVLRDFAWPFATRYADPLVLVAGTPQAPVNADWTYSYRLPPECVMARRLVSPTQVGRAWDPDPPKFRTGTDATGDLLFTHVDPAHAVLEFTARLDGAVLISDHVFQEALAWRLAAALAPSLAQADPEGIEQEGRGTSDPRLPKTPKPTAAQLRQRIADGAWQQYNIAINVARASAMKEQQQFPDGPAPSITARGDGWRTRWPWRP